MNGKCFSCSKSVYPTKKLMCLDKTWHKECFQCWECGLALDAKSVKSYDNLPYCDAHCPSTPAISVPNQRKVAHSGSRSGASGLVKAKKYDWKDSNLALFGSDTEQRIKKESAETEPAWQGAGEEVGLQVWRIVKFQVEHWPEEDYGKFYDGDSYIILNTYQSEDSEELLYDIHFWIGQNSSQDEYGTAAYKTVELDTYLDDLPVQHREVMNHESDLFKSYFPNGILLMNGGADTGFRSVTPTEYKPRLLNCRGDKKGVAVKEVPCALSRLDSSDVFILDLGLEIYQWNGTGVNKDEKFKATQVIQSLKSDRNGRPKVMVLEERSLSDKHKFYAALNEEDEEDDEEDPVDSADTPKLFRVSDEDGSLDMDLVKEGEFDADDLESKDVFVVDIGNELFVWIGMDASDEERKNGMSYAHNYLAQTDHPLVPVSVFGEGQESQNFNTYFMVA